ncbi:MAG: hypothetical protein WCP73_04940 [Eubacteriales bacterium]
MSDKIYLLIIKIVVPIVIISAIVLLIMMLTYAGYKGIVPGTGFIKQELPDANSTYYDVDREGNFYFGSYHAVLVYKNDGTYLYTLPVNMAGGATSVLIAENNNITVSDSKDNVINIYNQNGFLIETVSEQSNPGNYFHVSNDYIRHKQNGYNYHNAGNGIITRYYNGKTEIVFEIPFWQKAYNLFHWVFGISFGVLIAITFVCLYLKKLKWSVH